MAKGILAGIVGAADGKQGPAVSASNVVMAPNLLADKAWETNMYLEWLLLSFNHFTAEKNGMGLRQALASLFLSESYFTSFFYSLMSFCSTFNLFSYNPKKFLGRGSWTLRSWTSERQAYSFRSPAARKLFFDSSQENPKFCSHTPLIQIFITHLPASTHCCLGVLSVTCLSSCNTKELLTAAI